MNRFIYKPVTLRVAETYDPIEASEAHRRLEARGTRG